MVPDEQELTGGNASGRVVRIGNTVRKPWLENSAAVQDYLSALRSSGVDVPGPWEGTTAAGMFSSTWTGSWHWRSCLSAAMICCGSGA